MFSDFQGTLAPIDSRFLAQDLAIARFFGEEVARQESPYVLEALTPMPTRRVLWIMEKRQGNNPWVATISSSPCRKSLERRCVFANALNDGNEYRVSKWECVEE